MFCAFLSLLGLGIVDNGRIGKTPSTMYISPKVKNRKKKSHFFLILQAILLFALFGEQSARAEVEWGKRSQDSLEAAHVLRMGYELLVSEKYDSAIVILSSAKNLSQQLSHWRQVAYCLNAIAICYTGSEDFDSGYRALVEARQVERQFALLDSPEEALTEERMGAVLIGQHRYTEAVSALQKSIDIRTRLLPTDSMGLAGSYVSLGDACRKAGDFDQAMRNAERAQAMFPRGRPDRYPAQWAQTLLLKGRIQSSRGEHDRAIQDLLGCLSILQNSQMLTSTLTSEANLWLAACYANKGEYARAIEYQKTALAIYRRNPGAKLGVGSCYVAMGEQYANLGDYDRAVELITEGLQLQRSILGEKHRNLAAPLNLLARAYLELKQPDKALACVDQAIAIRMKALGEHHPSMRFTYESKGDVLRSKGMLSEALVYYGKALKICRQMDAKPNRYDVVRLLILEGSTELQMGKLKVAGSLLRSALMLGMRSTTHSPVQIAAAYKGLGDLACREGKYTEALQKYQQSIIHLCDDFADTSPTANPSPQQVRDPKVIVTVLAAKANTLRKLQARNATDAMYLVSALQSYEAALDISAAAQKDFSSTDAKLFHEQESTSLHQAAVDLAVDLFRRTSDSSYEERAFCACRAIASPGSSGEH